VKQIVVREFSLPSSILESVLLHNVICYKHKESEQTE